MHKCIENDWPQIDIIQLYKKCNSLIFWSSKFYLELINLLDKENFSSHKAFLDWLLKKDEIYK